VPGEKARLQFGAGPARVVEPVGATRGLQFVTPKRAYQALQVGQSASDEDIDLRLAGRRLGEDEPEIAT
jgi:hypothetical protein